MKPFFLPRVPLHPSRHAPGKLTGADNGDSSTGLCHHGSLPCPCSFLVQEKIEKKERSCPPDTSRRSDLVGRQNVLWFAALKIKTGL